MKRILSWVLTFAMVFTTFGPSVYATGEGLAEIISDDAAVLEQVVENTEDETAEDEIIEDEVVENVGEDAALGGVEDDSEPYEGYPVFSGEKLYVEYRANSDGYVEYDQSTIPVFDYEDIVNLRVTDGTNIYFIESVDFTGDSTGNCEASASEGSVANLLFKYDAQGMSYVVNLTARDGNGDRDWLEFQCKVQDNSIVGDGVYYSTDGVSFTKSSGSSMGIALNTPLYFYVVKDGERIEVLEAYGGEWFDFTIGTAENDWLNSLTLKSGSDGYLYAVTLYTAPTYDGGDRQEWQDLQFYVQETGYSAVYYELSGLNKYDETTGISVIQGMPFKLFFRDSNNNNFTSDKLVVSEESKMALMEQGFSVSVESDYIYVETESCAVDGTYTAYFTVNGEQAAIKIVVSGGSSGGDSTSDDGVYYSKDGQIFSKFVGSAVELAEGETLYFYVYASGSRAQAEGYTVDEGTRASAVAFNLGGEEDNYVNTACFNGTPDAGEVCGYSFAAAGTNWGLMVKAPEDASDSTDTDGVYYNYNGNGWQLASGTVYVEPHDIVQVKVIQDGLTVLINETKFEYDGMDYWYGLDYLECDTDGSIQTLYVSPDDVQDWQNNNRLVMKNTTTNVGEWYFDFYIQDVTKELWTPSNYGFSYSYNDSSYSYLSDTQSVAVKPGETIYIKLYDNYLDKEIKGSEAAYFHTVESSDDVNITYYAGDRWRIDAGEDFTGIDEFTVISNGYKYGPLTINVTEDAQSGSGSTDSEAYFRDRYLELPESGHATFDVGFSLSGSEYIEAVIGQIDYDTYEFVPFSVQHGYTPIYNDRGHITAVEFYVDELMDVYPDVYEEGCFTAALYIVDGSSRNLASCTGVHFAHFCDGNCNGSDEPEFDYNNKFSGTVEWRYAGETDWNVLSDGEWYNETLIAAEAFSEIELRFTSGGQNVSGNIYCPNDSDYGTYWYNTRSETDGEFVMVFVPETLQLVGEESFVDLSVDLSYYQFNFVTTYNGNENDVYTGDFEGNVYWRVAGETEWKLASSCTPTTPADAIQLDLFEVLEIQFRDEDGNVVGNNCTIRGKERGQNVSGLYNATEGGYSAIENTNSYLMRWDGYRTLVFNLGGDEGGEKYILKYKLNYPEVNPTDTFDGYAMAVTGEHDNPEYVSFNEFIAPAYDYTAFGIQFYDENGDPVDPTRVVPVVGSSYEGFDINYGIDYDWDNAQWTYESWEVYFNEYAQSGEFSVDFVIDGTDLATVTFRAQGEDSGDDDYYEEDVMFWFSDTGEDDDWAEMPAGRRLWLDIDRPFYVKVTDLDGNLIENDRIDEVYSDGELCTWYNDSDSIKADGELFVDRDEYELHLEERDGEEYQHRHNITFVIDGVEYSRTVIVGHDPMYFWLNWNWDFYVNGPFSISSSGTTDMGILEHTTREGWTADIKIGYVDDNGDFVPADVQTGFEILNYHRTGVPKTVRFNGAEIAEAYGDIMNGDYFHVVIEMYDEEGNNVSNSGCDVKVDYEFGGSIEFSKMGGDFVAYTGSETNPYKLNAGEVFNIAFVDENGNRIMRDSNGYPIVEIENWDDWQRKGLEVWQGSDALIIKGFSKLSGKHELVFRIEQDGIEYTTSVWVQFTSPSKTSVSKLKDFKGQAQLNGRWVENNCTFYVTQDFLNVNFIEEEGWDENDEWYAISYPSSDIKVAQWDEELISFVKFPTQEGGMSDVVALDTSKLAPGQETTVQFIVDGKLATFNLVRDIDMGESDQRMFTGKIYVSDTNGNRTLYYSFFGEDGTPNEDPYFYDGNNPLKVGSSPYVDFEFYDFRGEPMTGPVETLEFYWNELNEQYGDNVYSNWDGERLRLFVNNLPDGNFYARLYQRYIQGNAQMDINLDREKVVVEVPENAPLFDGAVYVNGKAYNPAEKDIIYLNMGDSAGITFKEIVNGAEVPVTINNIQLATNYDGNMLYMVKEDAVNISLNALDGGDSGIYTLDFIVNGKLCQVYVAYDLYCQWGNGNIWGFWEYAKEKDENGNYTTKGIRYYYDNDEKILSFWINNDEVPADSDGLVIDKAFFDATFKNVKTKVKRLYISEGVIGIEGKAAKALTNLETLSTMDRGWDESVQFAHFTLADGEFAGLSKLKYVWLNNTNIGDEAFKGCKALVEVQIEDVVEYWHNENAEDKPVYIGDNAFNGCTKLAKVYLNGNFVSGETPFKGCTKLTSAGNNDFGEFSIEYRGSDRKIVEETEWGTDEYYITYIPANLFASSSIKTAYLYDINLVESGAFSGCTALTKVSFNDNINTIEEGAFSGCSKISKVEYSEDLGQWYNNVYVGKNNGALNKLDVETDNVYVMHEGIIDASGNTDENAVRFTIWSDRTMYIEGYGSMMDFEQYVEYEWTEDGETHYEYAVDSPFYGWRYFVDEIYIGSGVNHIGDYAFYNFNRVNGVTMEHTGMVESTIGEYAFANMSGLDVFNMPMTVYNVADNTFENSGEWNGLTIRYAGDELQLANIENDCIDVEYTYYTIESYTNGIDENEAHIEFSDEFGNVGYDIVFIPGLHITVRAYKVDVERDGEYISCIPEYFVLDGEKLETRYVENEALDEAYIEADFVVGNFHDEPVMYLGTQYTEEYRANQPTSGKAGKNATWAYDDGVLVISGTGATYNYDFYDRYTAGNDVGMAPWADFWISRIIVKEGITALGNSNILPTCIEYLELPSTLKTIGKWNFVGVEMEEIVFPENLTEIGSDSFNEVSVNRIVFNDKLTTIGRETFQNMYSYTFGEVVDGEVVRNYIDITIPASVTSIGEGAFTNGGEEKEYCNEDDTYPSTLRSIKVDPDNKYYKVENGALMTKDGKMFIALPAAAVVHYGQYIPHDNWNDSQYANGFDGIYTVPDGVETLGFRALSSHSTITGINLPETLKAANTRAFSNLKGLTHIVLPDSLETLGDMAFEGCCSLTAIRMGANLKEIGYDAFYCCENLVQIDVDADNKNVKFENGFIIDNGTLIGVTSEVGGNIIIPSSVTTIGKMAFTDNGNITGIQIPASVTKIDIDAFYKCYNLEKIIVPDSVKTVGMWAFDIEREGVLEIYFTGTEAQWDKLIDNEDEIFDGQEYTLTYWQPEIKLQVENSDGSYVISDEYKAELNKYTLYAEHPYDWYFTSAYTETINPIFGESSVEETAINVYSTNEDVVVVNNFYGDTYRLAVVGDGEANLVIESAVDPSVRFVQPFDVTQMALYPELTATTAVNDEGRHIVVPTTKAQTITTKTVWDGEKWPEGTYSYSLEVIGGKGIFEGYEGYVEEGYGMEWKEGVPMPTVDAKTGKITIPKYTSAQLAQFEEYSYLTYGEAEEYSYLTYGEAIEFNLVITLEDEEKGEGPFSTQLPFVIYPQKVKDIDVTVTMPVDEDGMYEQNLSGNQAGKTIIMDAHAGDTVRYIYADATNWDMAYNSFTFTASASDCFQVVPGSNGNFAMVKLLNGNSGSVKVTIKSVDGAKSTTVTFKTGISVEELDITSNAPYVGVDTNGTDTYTIASGKSAKHTATAAPSNATTKGVKWYAKAHNEYMTDEELEELVTISSKGELKVDKKVPAGTLVVVWAETTDGTGIEDRVYYLVTNPAQAVYVGTASKVDSSKLDTEKGTYTEKSGTITIDADEYATGFVAGTLYAQPYIIVNGENGAVKAETKLVAPSVNWTVQKAKKNDISKYVTIVANQLQGGDEEIAKVDFRVDGPRNGSFIIRATAADGSGKYFDYTVNVVTSQYDIDMTAPNGVGVYGDTWVLTASSKGVTLKPTVEWNNGQSKPSDANYEILLNGEVITTSYKFKNDAAGEYSYTVRSKAAPNISDTVTLQVVASSDIYLGSIDLMLADTTTYDAVNNEYIVAEGAKVELIQYFNGINTTKTSADKEWYVDDGEITGISSKSKPISVSKNKHYFTVPSGTAGETITVKCVYGNGVDDPICDVINIKVVEKAQNIRFVKDDVQISDMKNYLKPDLGTVQFNVITLGQDNDVCKDFTVKSSNEKVLDIEKLDGTTFAVTPLDDGKVTVTITANDGSGAKKEYKNIQVGKVASPVTSITTPTKSIYVDTDKAIALNFALNATGAPATMSDYKDMLWTSSNEDILTVKWTGAVDDYLIKSTTSKGKTTNYYSSEGTLTLIPGFKTGKVTVTGKALDGSNKTVKLTVTVAANSDTETLSINVPNGTAIENNGKPVLAWGKSIKLQPTFNTGAKNTAVNYTVEAVEAVYGRNDWQQEIITEFVPTGEDVKGITFSGSTIKAASAGKSVPAPYSGWVKVTAKLNHKVYTNGLGNPAEEIVAEQYIYVVKPVSKISVAQLVLSKGKYTTKEVTSVKAKAGETLNFTQSPYIFTTTYKEYKDYTQGSAIYSDVIWTSSNTAVAKVDQFGEVTIAENAKNKSSVTIKAIAKDGTKVVKSIKITITK